MPMNLELHRSEESIWDRAEGRMNWDGERWLVGLMAGAFLVTGLRLRSISGLLFMVGGGALTWWASSGMAERNNRRGRVIAAWPTHTHDDAIHESSEESFPASDAPAWTPTTGNFTTTPRGSRRVSRGR